MAVGVIEFDPPVLPWRPLRVIYRVREEKDVHLWSVHERRDNVAGYLRPTSDLDDAVKAGEATRLPAECFVGPRQVVVRTAPDRYDVRGSNEVVKARRLEERRVLTQAIEAAVSENTEAAKQLFDAAILFGDTPPIAAALRRGYADGLPPEDPWRAEVIEEFATEATRLELDLVPSSLWWDDLPEATHRNRWLQGATVAAMTAAQNERPADLMSLRPVPQLIFREAAAVVATHKLHLDPDLRLTHSVLARLIQGDPDAVDRIMDSIVARSPPTETRSEILRRLEDAVSARGDQGTRILGQVLVRSRATDFIRHASLISRVEATIGDSERSHLWRAGSASLRAIRVVGGFAPWQKGEEAADQLRIYWDLRDEPIEHFVRLLRSRIGLEAVVAKFNSDEFDGCHVIDPRIPPVSYLDDAAARRAGRARFTLASALGWRILNPEFRGAWLSRAPKPLMQTARSELEQAANAFAAYLLAPRSRVRAAVSANSLGTYLGYRGAVRLVMEVFRLSFTAAFPHVANCHAMPVPFNWQPLLASDLEGLDLSVADDVDTLPVPDPPADAGLRLERVNGLSTRMAQAVAMGLIDEAEADGLIGTTTEAGRRWFRERVEAANRETGA